MPIISLYDHDFGNAGPLHADSSASVMGGGGVQFLKIYSDNLSFRNPILAHSTGPERRGGIFTECIVYPYFSLSIFVLDGGCALALPYPLDQSVYVLYVE